MNKIDTNTEIQRLHAEVKKLLHQKYPEETIIETFRKQGLEQYYIETIIENIKNDKVTKRKFRNTIFAGLFYTIGGILINVFSYRISANSHSSVVYIFWGIVAFGLLTIIRGFILYRK